MTGFGLAGHAYGMAKPSGVSFLIGLDALPVMDEALEMYQKGVTTGVNISNRANVHGQVRFERDWPSKRREIVYDPQTSGGLLIALPESNLEAFRDAFAPSAADGEWGKIGRVSEKSDVRVRLV